MDRIVRRLRAGKKILEILLILSEFFKNTNSLNDMRPSF